MTHVSYLYHDKYGPCFLNTFKSYFKYEKCIKHSTLCVCFSILCIKYAIVVPKVRKGLPYFMHIYAKYFERHILYDKYGPCF